MRIALDMDGVLADLHTRWLRDYNHEYEDTLTLEDIRSWDIAQYVKCGPKVFDYLRRPGYFRYLDPIPGAIDGVNKLMDDGHEILIVTATFPEVHANKIAWLQEHFPRIDRRNIIFTERKDAVASDVFVDDSPVYTQAGAQSGNITQVLLMDYPYNRDVKHDKIFRVFNWTDILARIEHLAAKL